MADFEMAEKVNNQESRIRSAGYLQMVGVTLWLKGGEQEAADLWYSVMQDIDARKIAYTDAAGGVTSGALLWYASCFEGLGHYRKPAEKFLKKKANLKRNRIWPGPIAQYLLGNLPEEDLILLARESKKQICQAYFYVGAKALQSGDKKWFREAMASTVNSECLIKNEYYLACKIRSSNI